MSDCLIRKDSFGKWHTIAFLLALVQIIINTFDKFYFIHRKNYILKTYTKALGKIAVILVPKKKINFSKFLFDKNKTKTKCITKKTFLGYFLLLFLYSIYNSLMIGIYLINNDNNSEVKTVLNSLKENISTKEGFEIITFTIVTKIVIKQKYYNHHYLSIIFIVLLSVAIDLLLNNYSFLSKKKFIEIFLNLSSILSEIIYLCFIPYILYKIRYSNYQNIMFFLGIMLLIINTISLICIITTPKESSLSFINNFWNYFDNNSIGIIITDFIFNLILQFIYSLLEILTINYVNVKFILIAHCVSKYFFILSNEYDYFKYICIIFFVLQFFFLMIYLEILELNFLNLNKDTIRSIVARYRYDNYNYKLEEVEDDDDRKSDDIEYKFIDLDQRNKDDEDDNEI